MRPEGTASELERRRNRAVTLLEQGESPTVVARILGITPSSLHRWRRMAREGQGLSAKPVPGAKRRLTDPQLRELELLLDKGAPPTASPTNCGPLLALPRSSTDNSASSTIPNMYVSCSGVAWIGPATSRKSEPGNATTRRWNAGRMMSSPASSGRPGVARHMWLSSTNRASCWHRWYVGPWPDAASVWSCLAGTGTIASRLSVASP